MVAPSGCRGVHSLPKAEHSAGLMAPRRTSPDMHSGDSSVWMPVMWKRCEPPRFCMTLGNWPCQKPPWGRLIAVNANTGEIAWQTTLGISEALPEGKRNTGAPNTAGPIVTAGGLVFIGATSDSRFRAFDSKTGKELWVTKLDYTASAIPITYQGKNGKQYVAIVAAVGGASTAGKGLVVFALP